MEKVFRKDYKKLRNSYEDQRLKISSLQAKIDEHKDEVGKARK